MKMVMPLGQEISLLGFSSKAAAQDKYSIYALISPKLLVQAWQRVSAQSVYTEAKWKRRYEEREDERRALENF